MASLMSPLQKAVESTLQDVTPRRLWLLVASIWLSTVVFFFAAMVTIDQHSHAVETVGSDAAPSVVAAHQIKIAALTMDADLADELLYEPGQREAQEMIDGFAVARMDGCKQLVAAARNITYGSSEQQPIENIQIALGQFEMQAQAARDMHYLGKDGDALKQYREALATLQTSVLPNCDALDKANADVLDDTYTHEKGASAMSRGFVLVMGLLLISLLFYTHIYLSMRFRRRLNTSILLAIACSGLFLQHLSATLATSSRDLTVAKEDAYNSVVALLDARANSYDGNAAESRWLLDRTRGSEHQKYFLDKIATVAKFEKGHDFAETIETAKKQFENNEKGNLPGFTGSLADELSNIRFPGEREAALETVQAFGDYCATDTKIRQLENGGDHAGALKLALGYDPFGSNFKFSKYDDALGRTLKINEDHLQTAVREAIHALDGLVVAALLVCLLVIMCTYVGLSPRLAEYETRHYTHKRH
jgi:hypothetical protein